MQPYPTSLLDVPISVFTKAYTTEPTAQTTLRRIVTTRYYRPQIEAIRTQPDADRQATLKSQLPAFTPVALLHHRRATTNTAQKISQQWPMLMGDIDHKENPGVDMARLKEALSTLPWVLLCAYSVRGGLWFIVHLPDEQTPDTLAAHYRYVQRLFEQEYGIKLDKSKGGNPTDLRFVSYDPAPHVNDGATVMRKTFTPPKPQPRPVDYNRFHRQDDSELLTRLIGRVEAATEGNRHTTLLKESRLAGGYVAAGRLDEETAICALEAVASAWPAFTKSQKTIRDGIHNGRKAPVFTEMQTYKVWS